MSLINAYCLPILTYGAEALNLPKAMYNFLEKAYSLSYSKKFSTYDNNVIKQCQYYCGYLPLCDVIDIRKFSFLTKMELTSNMCVSFLFKAFAAYELKSLLVKHRISPNLNWMFKHIIRQNFASSVQ